MTPIQLQWAGLFLVAYTLLGILAFTLLGNLEFPDILNEPGSTALPKLQQANAVGWLGMELFFVYALLFLPAALLVNQWIVGSGAGASSWLQALATASGALRAIWWGVWVTVVPAMAAAYSQALPANQAAISELFRWMNGILSTASEDIGVNFLGGVWVLLVSVRVISDASKPSRLGYFGLSGALCYFISTSEVFGLPEFPLAQMAAPLLTGFWFMAVGIVMLTRRSSPSA